MQWAQGVDGAKWYILREEIEIEFVETMLKLFDMAERVVRIDSLNVAILAFKSGTDILDPSMQSIFGETSGVQFRDIKMYLEVLARLRPILQRALSGKMTRGRRIFPGLSVLLERKLCPGSFECHAIYSNCLRLEHLLTYRRKVSYWLICTACQLSSFVILSLLSLSTNSLSTSALFQPL